jgi:hypothetical protein
MQALIDTRQAQLKETAWPYSSTGAQCKSKQAMNMEWTWQEAMDHIMEQEDSKGGKWQAVCLGSGHLDLHLQRQLTQAGLYQIGAALLIVQITASLMVSAAGKACSTHAQHMCGLMLF